MELSVDTQTVKELISKYVKDKIDTYSLIDGSIKHSNVKEALSEFNSSRLKYDCYKNIEKEMSKSFYRTVAVDRYGELEYYCKNFKWTFCSGLMQVIEQSPECKDKVLEYIIENDRDFRKSYKDKETLRDEILNEYWNSENNEMFNGFELDFKRDVKFKGKIQQFLDSKVSEDIYHGIYEGLKGCVNLMNSLLIRNKNMIENIMLDALTFKFHEKLKVSNLQKLKDEIVLMFTVENIKRPIGKESLLSALIEKQCEVSKETDKKKAFKAIIGRMYDGTSGEELMLEVADVDSLFTEFVMNYKNYIVQSLSRKQNKKGVSVGKGSEKEKAREVKPSFQTPQQEKHEMIIKRFTPDFNVTLDTEEETEKWKSNPFMYVLSEEWLKFHSDLDFSKNTVSKEWLEKIPIPAFGVNIQDKDFVVTINSEKEQIKIYEVSKDGKATLKTTVGEGDKFEEQEHEIKMVLCRCLYLSTKEYRNRYDKTQFSAKKNGQTVFVANVNQEKVEEILLRKEKTARNSPEGNQRISKTMHRSPKPHYRQGHNRLQHYGAKNHSTKIVHIDTTLVNPTGKEILGVVTEVEM